MTNVQQQRVRQPRRVVSRIGLALMAVALVAGACTGSTPTAGQAGEVQQNTVEGLFGPYGPRDGDILTAGDGVEIEFSEGDLVPFGDISYVVQASDYQGSPVETTDQRLPQPPVAAEHPGLTGREFSVVKESGVTTMQASPPESGVALMRLFAGDLQRFPDGSTRVTTQADQIRIGDFNLNAVDPATDGDGPPLFEGEVVLESDGTVRALTTGEMVLLGGQLTLVYDRQPCSTQCLVPIEPSFDGQILRGMNSGTRGMFLLNDGRVATMDEFFGRLQLWDPDDPGDIRELALTKFAPTNYVRRLGDGRIASDLGLQSFMWDLQSIEGGPIMLPSVEQVGAVIDYDLLATFDRERIELYREGDLTTAEFAAEVSGVKDMVATDSGRIAFITDGVYVWDPLAGGEPVEVPSGRGGVGGPDHEVLASAGAERIVVGGSGGRVVVIDLDAPDDAVELLGHTAQVWSVALLQDGRIAAGAEDGTVRVWSLAEPASPTVLEGHTAEVTGIVSLPDGRMITAEGNPDPEPGEAVIRFWDDF